MHILMLIHHPEKLLEEETKAGIKDSKSFDSLLMQMVPVKQNVRFVITSRDALTEDDLPQIARSRYFSVMPLGPLKVKCRVGYTSTFMVFLRSRGSAFFL